MHPWELPDADRIALAQDRITRDVLPLRHGADVCRILRIEQPPTGPIVIVCAG
jgi:hypothetical protein